MTDPSPADVLRTAATHVRAYATDPGITPPPWVSLDGGDRIIRQPGIDDLDYVVDEPTSNGANAAWIALMHPGVGLALADWLERAAKAHEASIIAASRVWPGDEAAQAKWIGEQTDQHALAVARQLLGEAS